MCWSIVPLLDHPRIIWFDSAAAAAAAAAATVDVVVASDSPLRLFVFFGFLDIHWSTIDAQSNRVSPTTCSLSLSSSSSVRRCTTISGRLRRVPPRAHSKSIESKFQAVWDLLSTTPPPLFFPFDERNMPASTCVRRVNLDWYGFSKKTCCGCVPPSHDDTTFRRMILLCPLRCCCCCCCCCCCFFFVFFFLLLGIQLNLVLLTEDLVVPGGCYHVPTVLCRPRRVLLTMDSEKSLELYRFDSISYKKNWKKKNNSAMVWKFPIFKDILFFIEMNLWTRTVILVK